MIEPAAHEKDTTLICDIATDVPGFVEIDGLRLRQILNNLLSNAVRFTKRGTVSLTVRVTATDAGRSELHFAVTDTGSGIASGSHHRIFDPFAQEQSDPTDLASGTGLGLAISRQLAELMGGALTMSSEIGQGSVFTLSVPLLEAAVSTRPMPRDPIATGKAQKPTISVSSTARILLAEDYDINRELITDMMRQLGLTIECAVDGEEAVSMIHEARMLGRPYGLVLMDLQMQIWAGWKRPNACANAFADDIENCLAAGMQAHLAKPVSMQRLADAVIKWTPGDSTTAHQLSERRK
jgi:CheY-like chemotaxis protein